MRADRRADSRREGGVEGISLFPKLCERAYINDFLAGKYEVNGNIIRDWNLIAMMQEKEGCVYDNQQMGTVWNAAINVPFLYQIREYILWFIYY